MANTSLTGHLFLAKLITQYAHLHKRAIGDTASEYIKQLGLRTGEWVESFYDDQTKWTIEKYAETIVDLKNSIGGEFEIISVNNEQVVVKATSCPFGKVVQDAPHLCNMTSSVFGGIAARRFGYGKVNLRKRIAKGDPICEVAVHLNPASEEKGDIYKGLPVTPENGDPFNWEEETILRLNEELQKSDKMIMALLEELQELRGQVNKSKV
ncbi:methanogen output domain 1-containing protein [Pseudalkalibacillus caeni]|uniref:Fis family transcriptional regulator n=1 Tax=Exobacillus caeni TaxID=2574798 RepID=A0A5R9F5V8_9BACL|nr:methanogen output domain 1-containing protein [Pseudalkalibacillus caeni]TLS37879.1 Fis family transcriptional regulator [Pseudalkalibacillus caeni]